MIFDDTVLDKRHARKIRVSASSIIAATPKAVINGIGVVTCVYVHPQQDRFWLIDYRIYDPQGDGKTKLDPLKDMLSVWVYQKGLPFYRGLDGQWVCDQNGHVTQRADAKKPIIVPSRRTGAWTIRQAQPPTSA